jgi:Uma2 family endonuclease
MEFMSVDEYFRWPEDTKRRELVFGVVREPPSPFVPHQRVQVRISTLLDLHVREHQLGTVLAAPMDVILDEPRALIVQPDVMFISRERAAIVRDFVWGAPDLVVEIASESSRRYDSGTKLQWYRTYGVREYWLADPDAQVVTVVDCQAADARARRQARQQDRVVSSVLPLFPHAAAELFAD